MVAAVAGVASFHHMHTVALTVGESQLVAWLFPFSVDGLAVVASVALLGPDHASSTPAADDVDDQVLVDLPPTAATESWSGEVSLFVPPLVEASSPVLSGTGSMQTNNINHEVKQP